MVVMLAYARVFINSQSNRKRARFYRVGGSDIWLIIKSIIVPCHLTHSIEVSLIPGGVGKCVKFSWFFHYNYIIVY